jgi:hypothetical protein
MKAELIGWVKQVRQVVWVISQVGRARAKGQVLARMGAALIALLVAGCNGTTNTTAATTSTTRTTDTFSGTVTVGGSDVHSFTVAATGAIDVTLTAAAPPATVVMGIDLGLPADGKCSALAGASTTASAGTAVQLSGLATAGTLCVDVHDAGSQSEAVNYTITVTHP